MGIVNERTNFVQKLINVYRDKPNEKGSKNMKLVKDNMKKNAIISVYRLETKANADVYDWQLMWNFVGKHYGSEAICRNILYSKADVIDLGIALDLACDYKSELNSLLTDERENGATHAFVSPEMGAPVYGIYLEHLSG